MTDHDILPFDGGNTPDDVELSARVASHYARTEPATVEMIERCARAVRRRVTSPETGVATGRRRNWMAGAVGVAAVAIVALTMRSSSNIVNGATVATVTPVDNGSAFQFRLQLPKGIAKVSVVGDFNGWDTAATPMTRSNDGVAWSAKITLLPGRHVYAYV
ncbi:MAG: hypothetical protein M3Y64_06060, partial [Gemmatimonadota bacterium]|nr:hypothetical protein [Gemmatimonadota bacterium]